MNLFFVGICRPIGLCIIWKHNFSPPKILVYQYNKALGLHIKENTSCVCDSRLCLTVHSLTVAWIYAAVRVLPFTNFRLISHDKIQMSRSGETVF